MREMVVAVKYQRKLFWDLPRPRHNQSYQLVIPERCCQLFLGCSDPEGGPHCSRHYHVGVQWIQVDMVPPSPAGVPDDSVYFLQMYQYEVYFVCKFGIARGNTGEEGIIII